MAPVENLFLIYFRRALAAYNQGDLEFYFKDFSPNFILHMLNDRADQTLEQYRQGLSAILESFPGVQLILEEVISQGTFESGTVAIRFHTYGIGKGVWNGLPVEGKKINVPGYLTLRFSHGQVVEGWELDDLHALLTQLGLIGVPVAVAEAD